MRKRTVISALVLIFFIFRASAQDKWDLREAVEYAITNNISVKQADLQTRYTELLVKQNKASQWPNLNFGSSFGYQFGLRENPTTGVLEDRKFFSLGMNLNSQVTLFNWFSQRNSIAASELSLEADKAQVRKVQDDIALNVAAAYLNILLAREQVNLNRAQVSLTEAQLENTRIQVEEGNIPELNAAQLEAQLATDSSNLISAEALEMQSLLQMKALLNIDASAPFDVETPPVDQIPVESLAELQPELVYQLALNNLSGQKVNVLRYEAALKNVKAARGAMYPSIGASGSIGTNYARIPFPITTIGPYQPSAAKVNVNGTEYDVLVPTTIITGETAVPLGTQLRNNFGQSVGISISVPLFNGRAARSAWERAKLDVQQSELLIEQDRQTLKQDIYSAYADATAALNKYHASRKAAETASRALNYSQQRYDLGLLSIYELINAQNTVLRARIEMLLAQYDYVFKMKLLEFYKGQGLRL